MGPPDIEDGLRSYAIWPHECRLRDLTYSAPIKVDLVYVKESQRIRKKGQEIGRMPIMLRSSRCALSGASEELLYKKKECPLDPGGYFIIKGAEKERISESDNYFSKHYIVHPQFHGKNPEY